MLDHNPGQMAQIKSAGSFVEFEETALEQSLPARFEQQVSRYPQRLAVKSKRHAWSYEALNQAANRLARVIQAERGSEPEPVILLLENDAPFIAAILGVLKTGKFYVPLDPALPMSRTGYILEDAQAGLVVTNNQNLTLARELAGDKLSLINFDQLEPGLPAENLGLQISPDALTWILYTSGSTGRPKGVVQTHRNVLQFIRNYTNKFYLGSDDRLSLLFSGSVNAAAHEIFCALLNGASLHRFDIKEEGLAGLTAWLREEEITVYSSVPTVFRYFVDTLTGAERFPRLRLLKMVGEPVYRREVDLYKKYFSPDCIFINRFGGSETGSTCWYFIDHQTRLSDYHVPIGYPVEGNEILLLDETGQEVGFNQIGEIAVKSRYLSPGYWRRPDLTEAAFSPDPAGGEERIYYTGDLGRRQPDGYLVCEGRKDFQVKIRGYRIETAEIELALLELAAIKEAVVMAREAQPGDLRLVAYLVSAAGQQIPTVSELQDHLVETLPDYMLPAVFVMVDGLPLAPNGKINRLALPEPDWSRPVLKNPFVAPETPLEKRVAEIWGHVLGIAAVGRRDPFLELGGNSLLATQIISRVMDEFQLELSLQSLLETPTVADMALAITRSQAEQIGVEDFESIMAELENLSDEDTQYPED